MPKDVDIAAVDATSHGTVTADSGLQDGLFVDSPGYIKFGV
jgi:hypothetical protein